MHLKSAWLNINRLIENLNSPTAPKKTHVWVESGKAVIFDKKSGVARRKLSPQGILDRKPIHFSFEHDTFGEPIWQINLERVSELAGADTLSLAKDYNLLLDRNYFLFLSMEILEFSLQFSGQMTSFDSFEFEGQILGFKRFDNVNVNGA